MILNSLLIYLIKYHLYKLIIKQKNEVKNCYFINDSVMENVNAKVNKIHPLIYCIQRNVIICLENNK